MARKKETTLVVEEISEIQPTSHDEPSIMDDNHPPDEAGDESDPIFMDVIDEVEVNPDEPNPNPIPVLTIIDDPSSQHLEGAASEENLVLQDSNPLLWVFTVHEGQLGSWSGRVDKGYYEMGDLPFELEAFLVDNQKARWVEGK